MAFWFLLFTSCFIFSIILFFVFILVIVFMFSIVITSLGEGRSGLYVSRALVCSSGLFPFLLVSGLDCGV